MKKFKSSHLLTILVLISVLFNLIFLGAYFYKSFLGKLYDKAYQQASQSVISSIYQKAKSGGEIEVLYNDEKIVLTVIQNEEN